MVDLLCVKIAIGMKGVEEEQAEEGFREFAGWELCEPLEEAEEFLAAGEFHQLEDDAE